MINKTGCSIVDDKVAYHMVPKCASRTVLAYGYLIKNMDQYQRCFDVFSPTSRRLGFLQTFHQNNRKKVGHYPIRFCVIRDPVDRFLSAFTDRIRKNPNWAYLRETTVSEFLGNIDDPKYTSSEDVLPLTFEAYKDAKFHTKPLVHFLGKNSSYYTHIFNINQIGEVKKLIEENSGVKLPELVLNKMQPFEAPPLSLEEIDQIKKRYKEDYDIYGKWL